MIYTSTAFTTGGFSLVGVTTPSGARIGLYELITNPVIYANTVEKFLNGQHPEFNVRNLGNDQKPLWVAEIVLSAPPIASQNIPDILAPNLEGDAQYFNQQFVRMLNELAAHKLIPHGKFTKYGIVEDKDLLKKSMDAASELADSVQYKPVDRLSFRVASFDELLAFYGTDDSSSDEDYADDELRAPGVGESQTNLFSQLNMSAGTSTPSQPMVTSDAIDVTPNISLDTIPVDTVFKYYDSVAFKDCITVLGSKIKPELIEGNPNNNTSQVYPNEQMYFNALCNLINVGLMKELSLESEEQLQKAVEAGQRSRIVDMYLQDCCDKALRLNWAHTGAVQGDSLKADVSEDDESDSVETDLLGYYTIQRISDDKMERIPLTLEAISRQERGDLKSAIMILTSYCNTTVLNTYAWAYALIQLLRWGERKPSCICIDSLARDEKPLYLDMINMRRTSYKGNVNDLTKHVWEDGSTIQIRALITTQLSPEFVQSAKQIYSDVKDDVNYPCGVALETTYEEDNRIQTTEVIDLVTLANLVQKGALKVRGLQFDSASNQFVFKTGEALSAASLNRLPGNIEAFKSLAITRYLSILSTRIKSIQVGNANNWVEVFKQYQKNLSIEEFFELAEIINEPDENTRVQRWRQKLSAGSSLENMISCWLASQTSEPFFQMWNQAEVPSELPQILTQVLENANHDAPVARPHVVSKVDMIFTENLHKCRRFLSYSHNGQTEFYAGYYTAMLANGTKAPVFCLWTAEEFDTPQQVIQEAQAIDWRVFVKNIYTPFAEAHKQGKTDIFFSQRCHCATNATWNKCLASVKRDQIAFKQGQH